MITSSTLSKLNSTIWKLSSKFNYYYTNQILKFKLVSQGLLNKCMFTNYFILNTFYNIVFFIA